MKNKTIKLFDDGLDEEVDEKKMSEEYIDDLFKEDKSKEKEGDSLEKILQESGNDIGTNLDTVLNSNPSESLSDKSIFTFDNDEWNTIGKA